MNLLLTTSRSSLYSTRVLSQNLLKIMDLKNGLCPPLSVCYSTAKSGILTYDRMNPQIKKVEYAVRGELAIRAEQLKKQLETNPGSLPFSTIINSNIGNPQQLHQKPITFFRQVASLVEYPELLFPENRDTIAKLYPRDAIARAEVLLRNIGSVGAYSHSQGIPYIRQNVALFIERRDGVPSDPQNIFLTQGASEGVQKVLNMITESPKTGIMIPIPQYPLYSATLSLFNTTPVPYQLKEEEDWSLHQDDLAESLKTARAQNVDVRALVIINPGNPTGQCLSEANMREIIKFCARERIILLADEVYQNNVYHPEQRPFHSFKKIISTMDSDISRSVELFSFHSISKGMVGECGRRGGYFECYNTDPRVKEELYKVASVSLCPNVQGQIMVDLMCNPPREGDDSYAIYKSEMDAIYHSLRRRSIRLAACFRHMEGVTCRDAAGAMYLFPRIRLPPAAIKAALQLGKQPDEFYCLRMLEATGVCVVPGSGFGQEEGTWHFRSTFLPPEELFDEFCEGLEKFHKAFMNEFRNE